jgi:hypothetical protein
MSIELTTSVLSIQDLTQSAKFLLTVLCFRANQFHEVYSEIKRLSLDCSCSIKTIERALKELRDKKYLSYTGKLAPNSKSIPIYSINLTHGQIEGGLKQRTDNLSLTDGQIGDLRTDKLGIRINNIYKDNKKDIDNLFEPTQEEKNDVAYYLKNALPITDKLQTTYLWLIENGYC